jgi:copper resistance protein B
LSILPALKERAIMRTETLLALLLLAPALPQTAFAAAADMTGEHGGGFFHMFRLETDYGGGPEGAVARWDLDGWAGGDDNKLWLRSEGEAADGRLHEAEFQALYSRNIGTFWDAQAGVRHDIEPVSTTYAALGFTGLAPYFLEAEAHLFISERGVVSARLRGENDFLLTQMLILQPYLEVNLSAQDEPERGVGAGLAEGEIGLQTRYEIVRKFAPYLDIRYVRTFGKTASIAEDEDEAVGTFTASAGLRLMF